MVLILLTICTYKIILFISTSYLNWVSVEQDTKLGFYRAHMYHRCIPEIACRAASVANYTLFAAAILYSLSQFKILHILYECCSTVVAFRVQEMKIYIELKQNCFCCNGLSLTQAPPFAFQCLVLPNQFSVMKLILSNISKMQWYWFFKKMYYFIDENQRNATETWHFGVTFQNLFITLENN